MSSPGEKRPKAKKQDPSTKRHILEVAAQMLREGDKEDFHIAQLVERANIAVPTVYYYFTSLNELVAHAQVINYIQLSRPVHSFDGQISEALSTRDEQSFWSAMTGHMQTVWRSGGFDGGLGIIRILTDIWTDQGAKAALQAIMRERVAFWSAAARTAQELGWISQAQDAEVLVKVLWAASIGHGVLGEEFFVADGDARVAAFAVRAMRHAGPRGEHPWGQASPPDPLREP